MAEVELVESGASRLAASFDAAAREVGELTSVNRDAGDAVIGAARIPRDTGLLESTATVEADAIGVTVSVGGPRAPYAPYVHARDPFLTDAYLAREAEVVDLYIGHVSDVVATIEGA